MKILITGYTGNLGTAVAKAFVDAGHSVRGLIHGAAISPGEADEVELVWGGLRHHDLFDGITSDIDAVVHCAWEGRGAFDGNFETTNLEGTLRLIEAAERNGVKTFVHISSVGVYGLDRSLWGKTIDEEQPLVDEEGSLNPYPWVKVLIERKCKELKDSLNMNLVVIRPGLLFSDEKAPAKKLISAKHKRYGILAGTGRNHLPYIHVDDVAKMISRVLEKPSKYAVYNCAPTVYLPAAKFIRKWGLDRRYSVCVVRIPRMVFRIMSMMVRMLKNALGKESGPSIVKYQILTGVRDIRYSCAKATAELGWLDERTRAIAVLE